MRTKRLFFNIISSLSYQLVLVVSGFILPRFIIKYFGSNVNGLLTSLTQFLGFISLLDLGVGAVVQSALYKPIAEKNDKRISEIYCYSKKFFRNVASVFLIYILALCIFYPYTIESDFSNFYIVSLIVIISINMYSQYFFGIANLLLLNADQKFYVNNIINICTIILNIVLSVILIIRGATIHIVKLTTSFVYLLRPLLLSVYVKKNYHLNTKTKITSSVLEQKWNGLAQHCATIVMNNTDVFVLTFFSNLSDVSVYAVYNLIVTGVRQFIQAVSNSFNSLLGNIYAKNEKILLNDTFDMYDTFINFLVVTIFTITGCMIIPFVKIYTVGINDADYIYPLFGVLMTIGQAAYCLRVPYNSMIVAVGHYKQTQKSAIVEMIINLVVSIVLVFQVGLIGVVIGTILAVVYRTIYFVLYLSKNIMFRKPMNFIKHIFVDLIQVVVSVLLTSYIIVDADGYIQWFIFAIQKGAIILIVGIIANVIFFKKDCMKIFHRLLNK